MCNFVRGFRRAYGGLINGGLISGRLINGGLINRGLINAGLINGGLINGRLTNGGKYKHNVYLTGFKLTRTEKAQAIAALIKICNALINQTNFNTFRTKKN